jgi:hypothetical protein
MTIPSSLQTHPMTQKRKTSPSSKTANLGKPQKRGGQRSIALMTCGLSYSDNCELRLAGLFLQKTQNDHGLIREMQTKSLVNKQNIH